MKLKKFSGAVMVTFLIFSFQACKSPDKRSQLPGGKITDYVTEGWLDNDTFQVRAIGAPAPKAKGFVKRRTQSKEAALLSAQKRVVELLVGAKVSGTSGSKDGESTGTVITKEFEGFVKGGAVVKESFDENDNCEITYRLHSSDLKEQAESLAQKSDFRK